MKFLIGVDEAGRGPLAGPVAIAALKILNSKSEIQEIIEANFPKLKDSKKLSEKRREEFFEKIKVLKARGELDFAVALVSAKLIDDKGIVYAIKSGLEGCLKKLALDPHECEVLLDGGLKAPEEFKNQKTIIKGDELEPAISLASIAAKVTRDKYMVKISSEYPDFSFEVHKGYGTLAHRNAIKAKGLCPLHRKSFCRAIFA